VSGLGAVLELIFAPPDRWVAVHAVAREWQDREVVEQVSKRLLDSLPDQRLPFTVRAMAAPALAIAAMRHAGRRLRRRGAPPVAPTESELRVWLDTSGRARVERVWAGGGERRMAVVRLAVDDLPRVDWPTAPYPTPDGEDVERLFSHRQLREVLPELTLEHVRDDAVAGRPVVVVRAERRTPLGLWPHWLPFGADEYELLLDREHGHLLGFVARADGIGYAGLAVTEITYGAEIDPALAAGP
jgi:hypothetical protein